MTAVLAPGYQVRWEVRDNIVGMREVTGTSAQDGIAPPTAQRFHHLFALEVGFDVVLGPERGGRRAVEIRYSVTGWVDLQGERRDVMGTIRHTQQ